MADMDSIYLGPESSNIGTSFEPLRHNPSHYLRSNCYFGASFMSRQEAESCISAGVSDRFMWGSDWPHAEGTYPYSEISLRNTFAGLPMEHVRRIVGLNAVDAFDMDAGKLAAVAQAIGPRASSIQHPVTSDEVPDVATFAFRSVGEWG
jgi:hypothetical protein